MRVTFNDVKGLRNEVDKLVSQIELPFINQAMSISDEIMELGFKLARNRKSAPEWVGALIHARNSLEKRDPTSTAIDHITALLTKYHSGEIL